MWTRTNKKRRNHYIDDGDDLNVFGSNGYWRWSQLYNDYYHLRKNGTYKWASTSTTKEMDEARRYAELSKQADSSGTARGVQIQFSKVPFSTAFLNRRISTGSNFNSGSFANPKLSVSAAYKISFSPTFYSPGAPAVRLGYVRDPNDAERRPKRLIRRTDSHNAKPARGLPISGVSLIRERGIFAPAVETNTREVSLSKVARDTRLISHIRIVCHDASSHTKTLKTTRNHWSIYLLLLNQAGSIRVNMTLSESNTEILEWELLSYPLSLSKIREWDFQVVPNVTVAKFWKLIHDNRRHLYVMSRGESDESSYWVYAVIMDLVRQRWLANGQAGDEVREHVQHFYSLGGGSRRIQMVAGLFY